MYLMIEDNPNCEGDERRFAASGSSREVAEVLLDRPDGTTGWCEVVAIDKSHTFFPATARPVEDSAAGVACLVTGGAWGLRLRPAGATGLWAVDDPTQWGAPFLVMDDSADVVRFKED
jgi:hypothetical protein